MGDCVLHLGDALEVLRTLDAGSVDALVTDPPAGIGFMGKEWDDFRRSRNDADAGRDNVFGRTSARGPEYARRSRAAFIRTLYPIFGECLRLLKPGAHGLVWAIPRTSHWTATALEDAGFEIRDVGVHLFGSGFPKSLDVSKAIDKQAGEQWREFAGRLKAARIARGLSPQDVAVSLGWPSAASVKDYEDGGHTPPIERQRQLEELLVGWTGAEERPVVEMTPARAGDGTTYGLAHSGAIRDSVGLTEAARQWSDWGTALKPAAEHWILCRKPLDGTVAANVLAHGTGALNIGGCRIEGRERTEYGLKSASRSRGSVYGAPTTEADFDSTKGRWPANLTLDEEAAALLDEQSGELVSGSAHVLRRGGTTGKGLGYGSSAAGDVDGSALYGDSGGASRFFYVAKPDRGERDIGCYDLPAASGGAATDRKDGSAGLNNPRAGAGRRGGARNIHPTVKPVDLMRWLCRLVTPKGGLVLDPFMGSGTTGVACAREGFRFIGIEREAQYMEIAKRRIHGDAPLLNKPEVQTA